MKTRALELMQAEFARPVVEMPAPFDALTPEQFRDIRFRPEATLWRGEKLDVEIQLLPMGWIYNLPVAIGVIEAGEVRALKADANIFSFGPSLAKVPDGAPFGFSGFQLHGPLNRSDQLEAYLVFQGASYFRAAGRGQVFGMSARGLAINTAQPSGEEFPFFREIWIEKPAALGDAVTIHALLDSPSMTGAYMFRVRPGAVTSMDVEATLYPRRSVTHVGIAPLTSMFLHGSASRRAFGDVRPAVHDSEGLAILNGRGEHLWRPLTNPKTLQTSAFIDADPKGFGLIQRDRSFAAFDDLDRHFEQRPTVWVEPLTGWGSGYVELIEIPANEQIHDNIVAYWKPSKPLEAGQGYAYAYRLSWGGDSPITSMGARVAKTRVGTSRHGERSLVHFVIDFDGAALKEMSELPRFEVAASYGTTENATLQRHPEIDGVRVSFDFDPAGAETVELRASLKLADRQVSESWLYRWTQS